MDAYSKPVALGRLRKPTKEEVKAYERAAQTEAKRRAALTQEERIAEDAARDKRYQDFEDSIQQERDANATRMHFDSVQEYCTVPYALPVNERQSRQFTQRADGGFIRQALKAGWYGPDSPSPETTVKRVLGGWKEGAEEVRKRMERVEVTPPVSIKRRVVRADQGDELDIHAVLRGQLDTAWQSRRRRQAFGPRIVRIVAQTNLLAQTSSEELFWRGAAVVKLADVLTEAGYAVEIVGAHAATTVDMDRANWLLTFVLKHAQSPLDIESLAGVVCNAGFHRTFGFRAYEACTTKARSQKGGTGDYSDSSGEIIERSDLKEGALRVFAVPYHMGNSYQARLWVQACCEALEQ